MIGIFHVYMHFDRFWDICALSISIRFMFPHKKMELNLLYDALFSQRTIHDKKNEIKYRPLLRSYTILWVVRDDFEMHRMH
jgi:hypothetical protein